MSLRQPTVTGYSPFYSDILVPRNIGSDGTYVPTPVTQLGYRSPIEKKIAQLMKRNQMRDVRAAFDSLIGAASGGSVTSTYKREKPPTGPSSTAPVPSAIGDFGGNIGIETATVISSTTTAADVTYLKQIVASDRELEANMATVTYPADSSGNGGGGKLVNGAVTF